MSMFLALAGIEAAKATLAIGNEMSLRRAHRAIAKSALVFLQTYEHRIAQFGRRISNPVVAGSSHAGPTILSFQSLPV